MKLKSCDLSFLICELCVSPALKMKYILVTGGVISGIGKGIVASSVGVILKSCNIEVTSIKIDPYINIDAGTFSPYEHGEVYVLDDGGEVDLDLGNYERLAFYRVLLIKRFRRLMADYVPIIQTLSDRTFLQNYVSI